MRHFIDTEFVEDGRTIDLISIGLVSDDGNELYLISSEFDESKASDWVKANVLPHLAPETPRLPRSEIAHQVRLFFCDDPKPEIWGYYADYDWVVFCQLFGRMIDLPSNFPRYCRDIKQFADDLKLRLPKPTGVEHHALADARWNRAAHALCVATKNAPICVCWCGGEWRSETNTDYKAGKISSKLPCPNCGRHDLIARVSA